ncbi:bifunctional DNA primase/helicase [Parvibaculaceae bacterium PLY_AMNH_Bact1]|nr:bifunctional DNA primase/helicase [Parvibaculaceae bacterium PLY_AMNH_Bact1]
MSLSEQASAIMEARGFDLEILDKIGVETCDRGAGEWISIPYVQGDDVVNHKYRTIGMPGTNYEKGMGQDAGAPKIFWNENVLADTTLASEPLIITEGELDTIAFIQAGFQRVMSVPDGAPSERAEDVHRDRLTKYSYAFDAKQKLRDVKEIILATDTDNSGIILRDELAQILGRARCKHVPYPKGCKDAADALQQYGVEGVQACVKKARWLKSDGVYRYSELPPEQSRVVYASGMLNGLMDEHLKVRMGDLIVLLGIPGFGKSTLLNEYCGSMSLAHGWNVAFFTPEQYTSDHLADLMQWYAGDEIYRLSDEDKARAHEWIEDRFRWIEGGDEEERDIGWMLEKAEQAIVQHGCKMIVIDPWNELDHYFGSGMTETEYTREAIKALKRLAKRFNVLVIVAHHPTKMHKLQDGTFQMPSPYDASGSAHWFNKADAIVIVHRMHQETIIRVEKLKKHGIMGIPGDMNVKFDRTKKRYYGGEDAAEVAA